MIPTLFLSILVLVSILNTKLIKSSNLFCDQKVFDSIFSLKNELYFHKKNQFWIYDGTNVSDINYSPSRNILYNKRVNEILSLGTFDINYQVFGVSFKYWSKGLCEHSNKSYARDECVETFTNPDYFRACIFGQPDGLPYHTLFSKAFLYKTNEGLTRFEEWDMESDVQVFCDKSLEIFKEIYSTAIAFETEVNETMFIRGRNSNKKYAIDYATIDNISVNHWSHKTIDEDLDGIFRYNNIDYGYNNYSNQLFIINDILNDGTVDRNKTTNIHDLFNCSKVDYDYYSPFEFCHQRDFQNVFSLGNQIYIQNRGKFWRYDNGLSLIRMASDKLLSEHSGVQLDTSVAKILKDEFFTGESISGFTFNFWSTLCINGNKECRFIYKSPDYYRACMYGSIEKSNAKNWAAPWYGYAFEAYRYGPEGLQPFQDKDLYEETYDFCTAIHDICHKTYPFNHLTSMTSKHFEKLNIFEIYLIGETLEDLEKSAFVHMYRFSLNDSWDMTGVNNIRVHDIHVSVSKNTLIGLFTHTIDGQNISNTYSFGRSYSLTPDTIIDNSYKMSEYSENQNSIQQNPKRFLDFFKCPSKTLYPIMQKRNLIDICKPEIPLTSAFSVGQFVYFQVKQQFWKFNPLSKDRSYDRYFSQLMNTYFDTDHPVFGTSYTYSVSKDFDRVVLIGKPNEYYIGYENTKQIYVLFKLNKLSNVTKPMRPYDYDSWFGRYDSVVSNGPLNYQIRGITHLKSQISGISRLYHLRRMVENSQITYRIAWDQFNDNLPVIHNNSIHFTHNTHITNTRKHPEVYGIFYDNTRIVLLEILGFDFAFRKVYFTSNGQLSYEVISKLDYMCQ